MIQPESELRFQFADTLRDVKFDVEVAEKTCGLIGKKPTGFLIGKPSSTEE